MITPDHSPHPHAAARLVHAAVERGWPPAVVDLVATLAIADIPHHIELKNAFWLRLSIPEDRITATSLAPALWQPSTPDGWRSAWINDQGCRLLAAHLRLPVTSLMYLQPPTDQP